MFGMCVWDGNRCEMRENDRHAVSESQCGAG